MPVCSALQCTNNGVHIFPKDPERRRLWEIALRKHNWKSTKSSRLCAAHFTPDDYIGKNPYTGEVPLHNMLKKTAVPSIFYFKRVVVNPSSLYPSSKLHAAQDKSESEIWIKEEPVCPSDEEQSEIPPKRRKFEKVWEVSITNQLPVQQVDIPVLQIESPEQNSHQSVSCEENGTQVSSEDINTPLHIKCKEKGIQVHIEYIYGSVHNYKDQNNVIAFYTGFETYENFHLVYLTLRPTVHLMKYYGSNVQTISYEDQFFMTMMKLRQNKCNFELGLFFQTSPTTVYNIFNTWINYIDKLWGQLNIWPEKELVLSHMPNNFKKYSQQTAEKSNLLKKCELGDHIFTDTGYNIEDIFFNNTPFFGQSFKNKDDTSALKLLGDKLVNQDGNIKQLLRLAKMYKILNEEMHHNFIPLASKIFYVCVMCCNLRQAMK